MRSKHENWKYDYDYEIINCIICKRETRRLLKHGKMKANKKTCGDSKCTNKLAKMNEENYHTIKCVICETDFKTIRRNSKCCSDKCRKKRYKNKCIICDNEFRSDRKEVKTCSQSCRWNLNRTNLIDLKCKDCGKDFQRPSFTVADKDNVFCSDRCNGRFHVQSHYGTFNKYGSEWYHIRKQVLTFYNYTCQRCNTYDYDNLNVHHCIPFRYFENKDDANNFENLIPMCVKCHREAHKENDKWYDDIFGEREDIV